MIAASDNRAQGAYLVGFYSTCAMRSGSPQPEGNAKGGDAFLVVPIPPEIGAPTVPLCNGKSPNNQP